MKKLFALSLLLVTSLANGQVLEVNIWTPKLGGLSDTIAGAQAAGTIMEEAGGSTSVGLDLDGSVHFVAYYENWAEWAAMQGKMQDSDAWNAFVAEWIADPAATLTENYLLDTVVTGGDGGVYQVFIWEPLPGRGAALVEGAVQAKALHEKDGAAVEIHTDQMGRLHYSMNFGSWEDWAKFQDAEHPEFDKFMQEMAQDPRGELVEVYTASSLDAGDR